MPPNFSSLKAELHASGHLTLRRSVVPPRRAAGAPGGLPFGRDDLANLHNLLEPSQAVLDLPFKAFAEQLAHIRAYHAGRRAVPLFDLDYPAPPALPSHTP